MGRQLPGWPGLVWPGLAWLGLCCSGSARLGSVFCRLCSRLLYVVAKPQVSVDTPCHYTIVLFGIASRYIAIHTHTLHTHSTHSALPLPLPGVPRCGRLWSGKTGSLLRLAKSLSLFSRLSPLMFRRFRGMIHWHRGDWERARGQ